MFLFIYFIFFLFCNMCINNLMYWALCWFPLQSQESTISADLLPLTFVWLQTLMNTVPVSWDQIQLNAFLACHLNFLSIVFRLYPLCWSLKIVLQTKSRSVWKIWHHYYYDWTLHTGGHNSVSFNKPEAQNPPWICLLNGLDR